MWVTFPILLSRDDRHYTTIGVLGGDWREDRFWRQ